MFIEATNLVKQYGEGEAKVYALDKASLQLEKGTVCVILGPSGSGKSTLLNMLGGLDVDQVMESLDIAKYALRFPKELSGGQQQRVAIARAMVKNPELLLCDELTGALDTRSSRSVLRFIEKINQEYGTTILIITHNEAIAGIADTVLRIRDGRIAEKRENPQRLSADEIDL